MDPLTLLKELYGEETIRKILTSGFDSVGKIAAATPDSLSYFTGLPEGLAAQVIQTAENALGRPGEATEEERPNAPIRPRRSPPRIAAPKKGARRQPKEKPEDPGSIPEGSDESREPDEVSLIVDLEESDSLLLDEEPLLDAGGVLKTFAARSQPREVFDDPDDILSEVGLSGAETAFLDGIASPWPNVPPPEEGSIPVLLAPPATDRTEPPPPARAPEIELADVTDWSWERDPDPVPRIIRAAELDPSPVGESPEPSSGRSKREVEPATAGALPSAPEPTGPPKSENAGRTSRSGGTAAVAPPAVTSRRSFWKFGR